MVYCDQDMCESKLGRLMQAFRADGPSEWQMDEFIRMAEDMHKEIELLRQAEKDAARYRWLRDASYEAEGIHPACFFISDGDLVVDGNGYHEMLVTYGLDHAIDEAMQCNK